MYLKKKEKAVVNADIRTKCGGVEIRDKTQLAAGTNAPTSAA